MSSWPEQGRERRLGSGSSATEFALADRNSSCRRRGLLTRRASLVPTSGHLNQESATRASIPCPASRPRSMSTPPIWSSGSRTYRAVDDGCGREWRPVAASAFPLSMVGTQHCELVLYELVFAYVTLCEDPWPARSLSRAHPTGRVWAGRGRAAAKGSR